MSQVTQILDALERGEVQAAEHLLPLVYDELRRLAAGKMARERAGQTLDATGLVHEAYLRLVGPKEAPRWENRRHFFAAAAEAMRRILIEKARRKQRLKRGGGMRRIDPGEVVAAESESPDRLLAIDEALSKLGQEDAEAAEVVKLHFFVGFSIEEAADSLGISRASAYRHWTYAKTWLRQALHEGNS